MYKKEVYTTWALILQLGISIMVPIFLLVFIGVLIKNSFGRDFILLFLIIGVAVGIRNAYVIIKSYLKTLKDREKGESELIKKHIKNNNLYGATK